MPPYRILFIDAYDSFSNSIIALLRTELSVSVESIKIDDSRFVLNDEAFHSYLDGFDAVVAGPGPGHPINAADIGLIGKLWTLPDEHLLPVLGICLGFQSLCLAFGGDVVKLREPRHGIMAIVEHAGEDIFAGSGKVIATQYHSLHVRLREEGCEVSAEHKPVTAQEVEHRLWNPAPNCPDLKPLAWNLYNVNNGPILMGVRHVVKPFWGVQYHPESICTNKEGQKLIGEWWNLARDWRQQNITVPRGSAGLPRQLVSNAPPATDVPSRQQAASRSVAWQSVNCPLPDVAAIIEIMRDGHESSEPLLLESGIRNGKPVNPDTGSRSIIGLPGSSPVQILYSTKCSRLEVINGEKVMLGRNMSTTEAFAYIDSYMRSQRATDGPQLSPFWGGLVGYVSYEAGLETIGVAAAGAESAKPDLWFVFVERSIVIDHVNNMAYVQSIRSNDSDWIRETSLLLENSSKDASSAPTPPLSVTVINGPEQSPYCAKVRACQTELRSGESYELCLTAQSTLRTTSDPWPLYLKLRNNNPAPFSSFFRLTSPGYESLSIASTSPERFLSWSRQGKCQFRPIKGTVKKTADITRKKAEEILGSAKERAENLMIVDLIRHDLAGVIGDGENQVRVPKLMSVEEYETVYQLVSVIEGDLGGGDVSGMDVLAASLPPGSMTGAPKKRSCELLQKIEGGQPRGLYSGVIGYFDVGGGGDFSVVIRTAFKWDGDEDWRVGAGGAVTALSDPEAEWEEMMTKRESVLNSLNA